MTHVPPDLHHRLKLHHQEHVLAGWDELPAAQRVSLIEQLAGIDLAELDALYRRKDEPHAVLPPREQIRPLTVEPRDAVTAAARSFGEQAIANGEVAVLLVAGGQGSRLGFDKPKGMFPVGPVSGASLFELHARKVLALQTRYNARVPFLVMTSPATHADTEAYFQAHAFFGLPRADVFFFQQGTMPAVDVASGRLLLEQPGQLFLSPNGHGGTLTALADSGLLADLKRGGVRHVFYFQVDNPLVRVADPAFVGRHIQTASEVSSKVVFKDRPEEKVGILAEVAGRCGIIEYSDLPADMAAEREPSGELRYRAGSPAIHLFSVPFLERITGGDTRLAYHIARKKVPHVGEPNPARENALKFELFVFDALPLADRWLAMSTDRADEFAPLKNATGADSPETCRQMQIDRAARWLRAAGVEVPAGCPVEIDPLVALDEPDAVAHIPSDTRVAGPTYIR